jgi:pimeloyl-ACP methyl ester carboxylesterase
VANERDMRSALLSEMRAVPEFAQFLAATPILALAPRGDGHPVLVLPGWTADDSSTRTLRWYLRQLGYAVHGWGLGVNEGLSGETAARVSERMGELAGRYGRRTISLVGWSLGGVYARALARDQPRSVRCVITLGSPINASRPRARGPLPMPSTSIYSRSDAIVPWRMSLERTGPRSENVEVRGSHTGLGHNAAALLVVADRLAQPEGDWRPFAPSARLRRLFPDPQAPEG